MKVVLVVVHYFLSIFSFPIPELTAGPSASLRSEWKNVLLNWKKETSAAIPNSKIWIATFSPSGIFFFASYFLETEFP